MDFAQNGRAAVTVQSCCLIDARGDAMHGAVDRLESGRHETDGVGEHHDGDGALQHLADFDIEHRSGRIDQEVVYCRQRNEDTDRQDGAGQRIAEI